MRRTGMELSDDGGQYTSLLSPDDDGDGQELRVLQDDDGEQGGDGLESEASTHPTLPSLPAFSLTATVARARAACGQLCAVAGSRSRNEYLAALFLTCNVVVFILAVTALGLVSAFDDDYSSGGSSKCKSDVTWGQPVHSFNGHSYQLVEAYKTGVFFPAAQADAASRCLPHRDPGQRQPVRRLPRAAGPAR